MRLAVVVPILIGLCATLASSTSIFLAGDATCADNPNSAVQDVFGWGSYLQYYLDETLAKVVNLAAPASSTRTYIRNGFFADLLSRLSPSDLVLLQFGHDDAVPLDDLFEEHRKRGVVPAVDETYRDILDAKSGVGERVHSFGHYLRQMIQAVREKQAVPILVSPTMTKVFDQRGGLNRTNDVWTDMMYKVAGQTSCAFLDSRNIFADMADPLGVKSTAA
ncbi:hypothetical protein HKX48_001469 [Thoreauomyces humboldtii]|nr:hypothetical protein HKX48_001469 [Thoreauomyces humboldtii]